MPPPAKVLHRQILNSLLRQPSAHLLDIEVWIAPGLGDQPHIRHRLDCMSLQQLDELLSGPRRVAYGEDGSRALHLRSYGFEYSGPHDQANVLIHAYRSARFTTAQ